MNYTYLKNMGIIDRLFRFIGLHLVLSLSDASIFESTFSNYTLSAISLYLIITGVFGIDPFYKYFNLNTIEDTNNAKIKS